MEQLLSTTSALGLCAGFIWNRAMWAASGLGGSYLINQSIRFNDNDSAYMHRTPSVAGNRKTWTYSVWFKRGNITSVMNLFNAGASEDLAINASDQLIMNMGTCNYISTQLFRDPSAWYHLIVAVDTTQATAASRVRFYGNGVEITAFGTETDPAQNEDLAVNSATLHTIGANEGGTEEWDGYLADVHFIDGAALTAASFGETDIYGNWVPIEYAGTDADGTAITAGFTDSSIDATNLTTYTFSSQALGTASADRKIIVGVSTNSTPGRTVSTLTVGGVSATLVARQTSSNGEEMLEMWEAEVPTGTTGDVVVTWSTACDRCGIGLHSVYGAATLYADVYSDNADPMNASINVPAGGIVVGCAGWSAVGSATWTGVTETYDENLEAGTYHSGGYATHASASNGLSVTCDVSVASGATGSMIIAVWRPADATVAYGTNGFHIDGADSSDLGLDTNYVAPAYFPGAVTFDGSNDKGTRGADLTGLSDTKVGLFSCWYQLDSGGAGTDRRFMSNSSAGGECGFAFDTANKLRIYFTDTGISANSLQYKTTATHVDYGVWHHLLFAWDSASAVGQMWIDGVAITDFVSSVNSNYTHNWTSGNAYIGANYSGTANFEGSMSDLYINLTETLDLDTESNRLKFRTADGLPVDLGSDGSTPTGTAPIIFCHIDVAESTSNFYVNAGTGGNFTEAGALVETSLPKGNSYTTSGLTTADQMLDSPTDDAANGVGNYATWNPLDLGANGGTLATLSNGNMTATFGAIDYCYLNTTLVGLPVKSFTAGTTYAEFYIDAVGAFAYGVSILVGGTSVRTDAGQGTNAITFTTGDYIGVTVNFDTNTTDFVKNDTTNIWSYAGSNLNFRIVLQGVGAKCTANFGQSAFTYTPPTGFKALCTANLPAPAIPDGSAYFQTKIFTGTGASNALVLGGNSVMQPDLVWIKNRDNAYSHGLFDAVRGTGLALFSDQTTAEYTSSSVTSFDTDGFTVGTDLTCKDINYCPRKQKRLRGEAKETGAEPEKEKSDETEDGDTNNG
jgi:hypothetical protein